MKDIVTYEIGGMTKWKFEIRPRTFLRLTTARRESTVVATAVQGVSVELNPISFALNLHLLVVGLQTRISTEAPRCLHKFLKESRREQAQVQVV